MQKLVIYHVASLLADVCPEQGHSRYSYDCNNTHLLQNSCDIPTRINHCWSEGMKLLDSRSEILKCYKAFKVVIGI